MARYRLKPTRMQSRQKLVSVAIVLSAGLVSGWLFRRQDPLPPPSTREPSPVTLLRSAPSPAVPLADQPIHNPVARLLGRIMPSETSSQRLASARHYDLEDAPPQATITPPPDFPPNPRHLPSGELLYMVEPGDTLRGLAQRYLGSPEMWTTLREANRDAISDPEHLPLGLELRIPPLIRASRTEPWLHQPAMTPVDPGPETRTP